LAAALTGTAVLGPVYERIVGVGGGGNRHAGAVGITAVTGRDAAALGEALVVMVKAGAKFATRVRLVVKVN